MRRPFLRSPCRTAFPPRQNTALDPEQGRHQAEVILASVLSNRKPPYSLAGGLFDTLQASGGDFFLATNNEIVHWLLQFRNLEGYDLLPAAAVAVTALSKAVQDGTVKKDEYVMLNCTGGGVLGAMAKGFVLKEADLVLSPDLPADEIVRQVSALF